MTVDDRWKLAREHRLCFLCLRSSHVTKTCDNNKKEQCKKCSFPNHSLLHKQADNLAKILVGATATKKSCTKDNSSSSKTMGYLKGDQPSSDQICVMKMKAVARAAGGEPVSFFAVIDTGATRTLCSRTLAKQLCGSWIANGVQEYKLFDGSSMYCNVMIDHLELQDTCGGTTRFEDITFVDRPLPFSEYLPVDDANPATKVDMVVGGDLAWRYILCSQSLEWQSDKLASHKFGTLWLSSGNQLEQYDDDPASGLNIQESTPMSAMCSKVRLAPADRRNDITELKKNLLHRSSDDNKLTTFREAEYVMNCRPLGKHLSDEEDIQSLRPLDLMTGYMEPNEDSLPTWDTEPKNKLRRGHMYTRRLSQEYWERWLRRYPLQLQER